MSKLQAIEEKKLVPAIEAATVFGYTKDYLLLLAKQGKINGKKIGHKWFIDQASATAFFTHAEAERIERRKRVSLERKIEFQKNQNSDTADTFPSVSKEVHSRYAFVETCAVMLIGLTIGLSGFLGTTGYFVQVASVSEAEVESSFFKKLAVSLYSFFVPFEESFEEENTVVTLEQETNLPPTIPSNTYQDKSSSLVIAPASVFSSSTARDIADSFSDEVHVESDPKNPSTGIITPLFKKREGEAYRFLMVPVTQNQI